MAGFVAFRLAAMLGGYASFASWVTGNQGFSSSLASGFVPYLGHAFVT